MKYLLLAILLSLSACGSINYHCRVQKGEEAESSISWDVPIVDFNRGWKRLLSE